MPIDLETINSKPVFYLLKLPLLLLIIVSGFLFEFIVSLPFMVILRLESRRPGRRRTISEK